MQSSNKLCFTCQQTTPLPVPIITPPPDCDTPACEENLLGKCIVIEDSFECGGQELIPAGSKLTPILNVLFQRFCEYREHSITLTASTSCLKIEGDGTASNPLKVTPIIDPTPDNLLSCTSTGLSVKLDKSKLAKDILELVKGSDELKNLLKEIVGPWIPEIPDTPDPEPEPTPCKAPTGIYTSGIAHNTGKVNWNAVTGNPTYNVRYRKTGDLIWASLSTNTNSYTLTSLSPSSIYQVQVQTACLNNLTSDWIETQLTTDQAPSVLCTAPTALNATNLTETGAKLNWNAVSGALNYNVRYRKLGASTWSTQVATGTSLTLTGLTSATQYQWSVQTVCSSTSTSSWVESSLTTATPVAVCSPASNVQKTNITHNAATVSWAGTTGATYVFTFKKKSDASFQSLTLTSATHTLTGLSASTEYEGNITVQCGNGAVSTPLSYSLTTQAAPEVPLCSPVVLMTPLVSAEGTESDICPAITAFTITAEDEVVVEPCALVTGLTIQEYTASDSSTALSVTSAIKSGTGNAVRIVTIANPSTTGELKYNWSIYDGPFEAGEKMMTADFQIPSTGTFEINVNSGTPLVSGKLYYLYVAEYPGNKRQGLTTFTHP